MRRLYVGFAGLLLLAVLAQFYLAATGAFDTAPKDESFAPHRMLGYLIMILALLATVVAALARMPGRLTGLTSLIAGLVLIQSLIRALADALGDSDDTTTAAGRVVFGLHALNGLAILALAGKVLRRARSLAATAPAAVSKRVPGVAASAARSEPSQSTR
jgi:hypothetical protein